MPFTDGARVQVTNLTDYLIEGCFYQITWANRPVADDSLRLHAQWRRSDPLAFQKPHVILDGVSGPGHYVGTYLAWEAHHPGWWGEGAVKFYLDDDTDYPTINGTGTEDYFGGAWSFEHPQGHYAAFTSPYLGMPQVIEPSGMYANQQRFGLYRWHLKDPVCFRSAISVTVQALGFRSMEPGKERYRPLQDDIASTAFYYAPPGQQALPTPTLHDLDLT